MKKTNWNITRFWLFACMLMCFWLVEKPQELKAADIDRTGWIAISTVDDLQKLFSSTGSAKYYLTKDLDLSRYGYWPGTYDNDFGGTFDGNGHSISNLTSTTSGLFNHLLPGAVVENLRLLDVNIRTSRSTNPGGIANRIGVWEDGRKDKVTISNCYVKGKIYDNGGSVGGILGKNEDMPVEINSCIVDIDTNSNSGILVFSKGTDFTINNCCNWSPSRGHIIVYGNGGGTINNCYANYIARTVAESLQIFSSYTYINANGNIGSLFKPTYLDSAASIKKSSYEGWDFQTVWMINRGINNGHPIPRWVVPYIEINAPYANMSTGTYNQKFSVELGSDVEDVQIYYTTDGSKPTTNSKLYTGSIAVTSNMKLKLFSVLDGTISSSTAAYNYKVRCAVPKANYPNKKKFQNSAKIKLSTTESGVSIYYTTDGTKPTAKSKLYQGTITLTKNTTLKAVTVKAGKTNSKVLTMHYIVQNKDTNNNTNNNANNNDVTYKAFYGIWCGASKNKSDAEKKAGDLRNKGLNAEVFVTTDWSNLNKEKWYVITAGIYKSKSDAEAYLQKVKAIYPSAYIKYSGEWKG